jgi:putative transposase
VLMDGYGESEQSWKEPLLDLEQRGLTFAPKLAIGDGALGFWKALPQVFSTARSTLLGAQDRQRAQQTTKRAGKPKRRPPCTRSGWPRVAPGGERASARSFLVYFMKRSTPRLPPVWPKIATPFGVLRFSDRVLAAHPLHEPD